MIEELDRFVFEVFDDEDDDVIAVCDVFPHLHGTGVDAEDAADDLADEITDYLRRVVIH